MADIHLIPEELELLISNLSRTRSAFVAADVFTDQAAGAVGHPRLADCLHEFSSSWDHRREKIAFGIGFLADAVRGIESTVTRRDEQLGAALRGTGGS